MLVRGSSRIAQALGISRLVIGLTVVAFGTSAPEAFVSFSAAVMGQGDIAVGNVVGSNIFNILLILGISAIISSLAVSRKLVLIDVPVMTGASLLVMICSLGGRIGRVEGLVLVLLMVVYLGFLWRMSCNERNVTPGCGKGIQVRAKRRDMLLSIFFAAAGLAMLVKGADWFIAGAVDVARSAGVSELVIGLTLVAAGTSLPELATSITAAIRGERDIAVGNIVGSNIFNLLFILGGSALFARDGLVVSPSVISFDLPVMLASSAVCLPVFFTGFRIARWEGLVFLLLYIAYAAYLLLAASHHDALSTYSIVMALFVIPLIAITFIVIALREMKEKSQR